VAGGGTVTVRIIFTEESDKYEAYVRAPQSVEAESGWVHVKETDTLGIGTRVKSYPAHEVATIIWDSKK